MNDTLVIEVTLGDIKAGKCTNPYTCAIALAVTRATGSHAGVAIRDFDLLDPYGNTTDTYNLPAEAVAFICAFDNKRPVEPFTFTATRKA